jgi:hypothetical protein
MKVINVRTGVVIAALLVYGGALYGLVDQRWYGTEQAFAASPQQKAEARKDLDQVMASLQGVDTAYASGNAAEAQTKFEQARSSWGKVSAAISAREAREAQLLFDSLGKKLNSGAPATEVKSTISGMVEELRADIAGELR